MSRAFKHLKTITNILKSSDSMTIMFCKMGFFLKTSNLLSIAALKIHGEILANSNMPADRAYE